MKCLRGTKHTWGMCKWFQGKRWCSELLTANWVQGSLELVLCWPPVWLLAPCWPFHSLVVGEAKSAATSWYVWRTWQRMVESSWGRSLVRIGIEKNIEQFSATYEAKLDDSIWAEGRETIEQLASKLVGYKILLSRSASFQLHLFGQI